MKVIVEPGDLVRYRKSHQGEFHEHGVIEEKTTQLGAGLKVKFRVKDQTTGKVSTVETFNMDLKSLASSNITHAGIM